jgi:dipeptidyl aminopeptidase/acylaminoacyl peptidase
MRQLSIVTAALLLAVIQFGAVNAKEAPAANAGRSATVDDVLRLENSDGAAFDPQGRRVIFNLKPAYKDRPDFGAEARGTYHTGGFLMVADRSNLSHPHPLFPAAPRTSYWVANFSPDGTMVAFFQIFEGRVNLGIYDFATQSVRLLQESPDFTGVDGPGMVPVWVNNRFVIYPAMTPGEQPIQLTQRYLIAEKWQHAWRQSWMGREPSFRQVSSGLPLNSAPLPGRLIQADVITGQSKALMEGRFTSLTLSPDGHMLAALREFTFTLPSNAEGDWITYRQNLWVFDLRGGRAQDLGAGQSVFEDSIVWSPDSQRLAYFAWNAGDRPAHGLYRVYDARSKEARAWPHRGLALISARERGYPDRPERAVWVGERLAIAARSRPDANAEPEFTRGIYHLVSYPRRDWWLLDDRGGSTLITAGFNEVSTQVLSAFGNRLYILADGNVWRIGVDGKRTPLTHGQFGRLKQDWQIVDLLYLIDPLSARYIVLRSDSRDAAHFVSIDLERGLARQVLSVPLKELPYQTEIIAADADHGAIVFQEGENAGTALVLRSIDGPPHLLGHLNQHLAELHVQRLVKLTYPSTIDGRSLTGCLQLPDHYVPGQRYPMIVQVYPANNYTCSGSSGLDLIGGPVNGMDIPSNIFTGRGYLYLRASTPADLERDASGPLSRITRNILDGVDAAVREGYADAGKVGIFGGSQGGFAALWIATQTDRFAAIVSMNGWSDTWRHTFDVSIDQLFTYPQAQFFDGDFDRYETPGDTTGIGKTVWEDPDAYLRNSPLAHANQIHTPILLVNSDMDGFNMGEYDAMFTALNHLKRRADYLTYWGEGHGLSSPANIRHSWQAIFTWFDTYVTGQPEETAGSGLQR